MKDYTWDHQEPRGHVLRVCDSPGPEPMSSKLLGTHLQLYVVVEFLAGGCEGLRGAKFKVPQLVLHPGPGVRKMAQCSVFEMAVYNSYDPRAGTLKPSAVPNLMFSALRNRMIRDGRFF